MSHSVAIAVNRRHLLANTLVAQVIPKTLRASIEGILRDF